MSENSVQDFLAELKKAAAEKAAGDNVEKENDDTSHETGDLTDDAIRPSSTGERDAEHVQGMKDMGDQHIENTQDGATEDHPKAPDLTNAKPTGEDPANENTDHEYDLATGNPPLLTAVEKRVMKEGYEKVALGLADGVFKAASAVVENLSTLVEKQAGEAAAELDLRKQAAIEEELTGIDAYAKEAAAVYKAALDEDTLAAAEEAAAAAAAEDEALAAAVAADDAAAADPAMALDPDEDAVALAEALAEEQLTPEELMLLAEGAAQAEEGPIEPKIAKLQNIAALLTKVSHINSLRATGRAGTIKKAGIAKCGHMLNLVRGLKTQTAKK